MQLVLGAALVALAFPATVAGWLAVAILAGALGIATARAYVDLPAWLREPGRVGSALAIAAVVLVGLSVFWETMTVSPDWQLGDWGPQHAVLARIMPSLPGLDVPVWNHAVSTGDAPLELYPALTYLVTGHVALALGLEGDLPLVFMIVATIVHLALAAITTALAIRLASRKLAILIGLMWVVDGGAVSHGGTVGLFRWAILHSAFAHVFSMIAVLGILAALRRPRASAALAIWLGTAIATAAHPAALLMAGACAIALGGVTLLAADVPPRRALVAIGHLALGVALGALVWMPAAERLLAYGQHFSNELYTPVRLLQVVMSFAMPITVYSLIVYAGYVGMIAGLFSRRAEVVFVAIVGFALLLGLCDVPYLGLGLVPGQEAARLGVIRLMLLERPFSFVAAAYLFSLVGTHAVRAFRDAPVRQRMIAAALLGIVGAFVARVAPAYFREEAQRAYDESRVYATDPEGRGQLVGWAHVQASGLGPSRWARALFEQDTHEQLHLTALTGLPTLHLGPLPDLLLRERIEDTSAASLARFNVRWVIGVDKSPSLGDPATEIVLGTYHIRELPDWDGKFARIEKGSGDVIVHRLDDRGVEIEVTNTTEPVLVALGTGFYPRWQARHQSGATEPVYALPAIEGGTLHVVSAWVAPGRTTFTVDAPLPSDGDGRGLALGALAIIVVAMTIWLHAHWRVRVLRRIASARRRVLRRAPLLLRITVWLVVAGLFVRGCLQTHLPARALLVGSGVRGAATVEARALGGVWQTCDYTRLRGDYDCDGLVTVLDATANLVNDATPSWPLITPAVVASAYMPEVEVRISRTLRVRGRYWAAASAPATLAIGEGLEYELDKTKRVIELPDSERTVQVTARVPFPSALKVTFVAEDRIEPARPFLAPPPGEPPAAVRAIR